MDEGPLFGERDFQILKFLASHPTASYSTTARELHYRPETVAIHIESLKERNLYAGTMGLLCYQRLGLAYVPVLVRAPLGNLEAIFNACRAHPYIHYSSRTLGSTDGAFLTFTPPIESTGLLVEFFDELAARGLVTDHRVYVCNDVKRYFANADLQIYNRTTGVWDFNWKRWLEEDAGPATIKAQPRTVQIEPNLDRLDGSDIRLISTITNDASIPTEEMSKATGLLTHQVRRRRRFLEDEGFIIGYRAMISYSRLHLHSSTLFNCNAPPHEVEVCKNKLLKLPFPETFVPTQNGFLCQLTLPSEGLSFVHKFLTLNSRNVEVSWFDLTTSDVAIFNAKAFGEDGWRKDRAQLMEDPLREAKSNLLPSPPTGGAIAS